MPGMSGLELLPKAKALRPDVPVIMITAYGDAETKRKASTGRGTPRHVGNQVKNGPLADIAETTILDPLPTCRPRRGGLQGRGECW
jgi:CheY-like chemotaxis protein